MKRSARAAMLSGVVMLVVSAMVFAPVRPTPAPIPAPTVRLVAAVSGTQQVPQPPAPNTQGSGARTLLAPSAQATGLPNLLVGWLERIIVPPSASAPFPQPDFPPAVVGNSIDSLIKNVYNAAEPWVQYGFELAAYAVGWVPYVGWLAPQIMIFYNLVERIVRSITFNIADWLGGNISFWDGLANVVVDTVNSFIYFANDQLAFWLPPLPPLPPIGPFAAEAPEAPEAPEAGLMAMSSFDESTPPGDENATEEEPVEALGEDVNGEEPTEEEGTGGQQLAAELDGEGDGELVDGQQEQIEEVTDSEETNPDLPIDGTKPDETDNLTTTDSSGTVQAQGEIRSSPVATPGTTSSQTQDPNGSSGVTQNEEPADPTQAPSPQTPSTHDDGDQNTAGPGDDAGSTPGTE